jgi:UPF0271 protein
MTTMRASIDLNADLGESFGRWRLGDDAALLAVVTSANVACGGHAGDPVTMRQVCERAVARGVRIGAQVGYHDLAGFGRRYIAYRPDELTAEVIYQIGALDGFARVAGDRVRYVKPHGALYNRVVVDEEQAAAVVAAVLAYDAELPLLGLPGSALLRLAAAAGLRTVPEAFPDRAYTAAGTLLDRGVAGAVLDDADEIAARAVSVATRHELRSVDGAVVRTPAASVCPHGDSPSAARTAAVVRAALEVASVRVAAFT